ncbi:YARHG domain-containing protein [Spirochaeta africana]|uniref:YARHG domain-containing protein n=1 Tax=Spirochaeta africana (strain ATCC 700263 / DSM 8902 / Z-7692) TaxID=889378 RepID=H9UHX7_SPIAZ|nr:YARHG domain-containing protein [Spirochaeta africana]AFG37120.1 hypothetical protein Spiaf_1033 [Spirochaeta africana DSM 8902]
MRISLLTVLLICTLLLPVGANDAFIQTGGGDLRTEGVENTQVAIHSEVLTIELFDDGFAVTVEYIFRNRGEEITVETAFPEFQFGTSGYQPLDDFRISYTDGEKIPTAHEPVDQTLNDSFLRLIGLHRKQITFAGYSDTGITISYRSPYGAHGISRSAAYLLGPGSTWNGPIGELTVDVITRSPDIWIEEFPLRDLPEPDYQRTGNTSHRFYWRNLDLAGDEMFYLAVATLPPFLQTMFGEEMAIQEFMNNELRQERYHYLTREQLRLVRNYIFARHGYSFQSPDLRAYFADRDWYQADPDFSFDDLTDLQRRNARILQHMEDQLDDLP